MSDAGKGRGEVQRVEPYMVVRKDKENADSRTICGGERGDGDSESRTVDGVGKWAVRF